MISLQDNLVVDEPLNTAETTQLDDDVLLSVQGVSKKFCRDLKRSLLYGMQDIASEMVARSGSRDKLREKEFWAVDNISFELKRGECIGLLGRNGAGKTTLLKMINGLIKPDRGSINVQGDVAALIALGAGFNPILTGRENIYVNASILGLSNNEIKEKIDDIVDFAEVEKFIDSPVQSYSSGMQARLGFAVATALNPDLLILDEVLSVGDANFRGKCYKRIGSVLKECAVVFVSHNAYSVRRICNSALWLKSGKVMFRGDVETAMRLYSEDSSFAETSKASINTAEYISNLEYEAEPKSYFDRGIEKIDLNVSLTFRSSQDVELGLAMANIVADGDYTVGQAILNDCISQVSKGKNSFVFCLEGIQLARGAYSLAISIFDSSGKEVVLNLRNIFRFQVINNLRYGPHYAIGVNSLTRS